MARPHCVRGLTLSWPDPAMGNPPASGTLLFSQLHGGSAFPHTQGSAVLAGARQSPEPRSAAGGCPRFLGQRRGGNGCSSGQSACISLPASHSALVPFSSSFPWGWGLLWGHPRPPTNSPSQSVSVPPRQGSGSAPFLLQVGHSRESPGDELNLCGAAQRIPVIACSYRGQEGSMAPVPTGTSPTLGAAVVRAGGRSRSVSEGPHVPGFAPSSLGGSWEKDSEGLPQGGSRQSGERMCPRLAEMGLGLLLPVLAPGCPFPTPSHSTLFPPQHIAPALAHPAHTACPAWSGSLRARGWAQRKGRPCLHPCPCPCPCPAFTVPLPCSCSMRHCRAPALDLQRWERQRISLPGG